MRLILTLAFALALSAAPPTITELQPRGAQKGRPFKLTVSGMYLGEGAMLVSTLPATFTPIGIENTERPDRAVAFLVEPTADWSVGVYPVRIKATNGISNILLFTIGAFPEITEDESRPGSLPHQNDNVERAQTIPSSPLTLNGTLKGPERDFYRIQAKAGEKRVFEVEARRCGSAIDPVIRVYDGAGKPIAKSQDDPLLSLDPRLAVTFPKDGYYYIEVHDARFSTQTDNFYRLKSGLYEYATEVFPLGGRRGEQVNVSLGAPTSVKVNLGSTTAPQTFVNLPNSPALPVPFAIGDYPEVLEPVQGALQLPVTVNGRLAQPGEVDKYELAVTPGEEFLVKLQARELGTSKIIGLITIYDEKGKRLASGGDGPLPVDVAAVQVSSRTQGDPSLQFKVPEGVNRLTIAVEDLARRGGTHYAYRLIAYKAPFDLQATILTPYVNIPAGGTALVNVSVDRQGYSGRIRVEATNLPKGISAAGGDIPAEVPDPNNRATSRRAMLTLTAEQNANFDASEIAVRAIALDAPGGSNVERAAKGVGYAIAVNGATSQGVVDRQRPLTGAWLGYELPAAKTDPQPASLELTLENSAKKESGYEFRFRWRWNTKNAMLRVPETVSAEVPNFIDLRIIEMAVDPKDKTTGTFLVTSTKNTLPALYNIMITGRLMAEGERVDVYSPIMSFTLPADTEEKNANASAAVAR
jgi:hypothetical protein